MKSLLLALVVGLASSPLAWADWQDEFSTLLGRYANSEGVDYAGWKKNAADLGKIGEITEAIGTQELPPARSQERLAYLLNAYNALILNRVLDDYPTKGVGGGNALGRKLFFGGRKLVLAGEKMSFNDLETDLIRKAYDEPRIHFALNCASASCPPLRSSSYRAATLDQELDEVTRGYITGNPLGLQVKGRKVLLSEIFKWYADDFKSAGGVAAFVGRYRKIDGLEIGYQDYDWSLNDR